MAGTVFYIDRLCVTFRKRARDECICQKSQKPVVAKQVFWKIENQTDINHEPVIRGSRNKILK